jgi:hypothetical protein
MTAGKIVEQLREYRGGDCTWRRRMDDAADFIEEQAATITSLTAEVEDAVADRDEWKQQHENLLAIYRAQTLEMLRRTELLRRALAYLPTTYGLTQEIRTTLPPQGPEDALTVALAAIQPTDTE